MGYSGTILFPGHHTGKLLHIPSKNHIIFYPYAGSIRLKPLLVGREAQTLHTSIHECSWDVRSAVLNFKMLRFEQKPSEGAPPVWREDGSHAKYLSNG
jgi:hypothetical protein